MHKVSVLIPAYNSARTIGATLDSVVGQTLRPHEILVMNDGSTDGTKAILARYVSEISIFEQENGGVASARNALIRKASGELIAFLDSDDIWHPRYLETHVQLAEAYPETAAFFTGHVDFVDGDDIGRLFSAGESSKGVKIMSPLEFLVQYGRSPAPFVMSYCCVKRLVLAQMGAEPFRLRTAEDVYFCNRLLLEGAIGYYSAPLVAYRVRPGSLSSNRILLNQGEVGSFELLSEHFNRSPDPAIRNRFRETFALKRRLYAKTLMGARKVPDARSQLLASLRECRELRSLLKSVALLMATYLPHALQPRWPSKIRQWERLDSRS